MEDFLGMKKKRSNERYHMCRHQHTDHTPPRTSSIPVLPIMTNKDGRTPALPLFAKAEECTNYHTHTQTIMMLVSNHPWQYINSIITHVFALRV